MGREENARLVLFRAGAGFGKTVAMRQYYEHLQKHRKSAAWLTLCALDSEFQRFLVHLMAACRVAVYGKKKAAEANNQDSDNDQLAIRLLDEVTALDKPFTLFLDQFELVSNQSCADLLRLLLDRLPPQCQLVIASRETPNLQLGRLRALGQLIEIDQAQLCFSPAETTHFLQDQCQLLLTEANIRKLHSDTEGWPAALGLAAKALEGKKNPHAFITSFSGSNTAVAEYLAEDVLMHQTDEFANFLIKSSILRELYAPLCDIVCDTSSSEAIINQLELSSLCESVVDGEYKLYRYNSLFADFLRSQLERQHPGDIPHLHLKAAKWFEAAGRPVRAIEHAMESGDTHYALSLLEEHVDDLLFWGRFHLLARWLDAQPRQVLAEKYKLRLAHVWSLVFTWRAADALKLLESLESDVSSKSAYSSLRGEMDVLRFYILANLERSEELFWLMGEIPVASSTRSDFANSIYVATLATFKVAANQFDDAINILEHPKLNHSAGHKEFSVVYTRCIEGLVDLTQNRLRQAMAHFRVVLHDRESHFDRRSINKSIAAIHLAEILYEIGDIEEAERLLALYMAIVRDYGPPDALMIGHVIEARIAYNRGDTDRAFLRLSELEHLGLTSNLPRAIASAQLERARIAIVNENPTLAEKYYQRAAHPETWDRMRGLVMSANDIETVQLCRFRLNVCGNVKDEVVREIKTELKTALSQQRLRRALKLNILLAKAQHATGLARQAMRTLQGALETAFEDGQVRIFLDEGPAIIELIRELALARQSSSESSQNTELTAFIGKILSLAGIYMSQSADQTAVDSSVILSPREAQILDLLSLGLSNIKIAESIFVTETTVRAHLRKINVKLGTSNRTQAVSVARRMGLIK
ncbi:MAG: LuxR family transcriptional regulator [Gammaproteobacteria bacterium]|nr:LuxR family transcriptional regulator [Gammaproteobacteria bacterium]